MRKTKRNTAANIAAMTDGLTQMAAARSAMLGIQKRMRALGNVTVNQDDRVAAADIFGSSPWSREQFLTGKRDKTDKVLAFARHRQAAEKSQQERDAVVVQTHPMRVSGMSEQYVRNGLATAIRSQGHE